MSAEDHMGSPNQALLTQRNCPRNLGASWSHNGGEDQDGQCSSPMFMSFDFCRMFDRVRENEVMTNGCQLGNRIRFPSGVRKDSERGGTFRQRRLCCSHLDAKHTATLRSE